MFAYLHRAGPALAQIAAAVLIGGAGFATTAHAAAGWQAVGTANIPTGTVNQQLGYTCPSNLPVALNGSYAFNSTGQASQVFLTFNGTRIDIPSFGQWAWHFYWPGGAPAGTTVLLDVYCVKK
jgi:hypothetical protein